MNTATYNDFFREVSIEKGKIASLSDGISDDLHSFKSVLSEFDILWRCRKILKKYERLEKAKITSPAVLEDCRGLMDDLADLINILKKLTFHSNLASWAASIIDDFENKIENLEIATDQEIRDLITSIDEKIR